MKKVISLMLSVIMLLSAAALPTWAAVTKKATTTTVTPKTYIAKQNYKTKLGYVDGVKFKYNDGQIVIYENSEFYDYEERDIFRPISYIRSNIIYYGFNADVADKNTHYKTCNYLCSSDIEVANGKNRKVLFKGKSGVIVIGGYGASVIFRDGSVIYKYYKGKISKLFKTEKGVTIFNGKLYYDNKSYDLKTGKTASFTVKSVDSNEKYLTYINKNNNLKRLDCNGKTQTIATNVYKYYWSNTAPTVIYSKLSKSGDEILYKRTADAEPVKIATVKQMKKMISEKTGEDCTNNYYCISGVKAENRVISFCMLLSKEDQSEKLTKIYDMCFDFKCDTMGKKLEIIESEIEDSLD